MKEIENFVNEPSNTDLSVIVKALDHNDMLILDLVRQLGPSLTSMSRELRSNATRLLAEAIDSTKSITDGDLEPLSDFFCDRIKDHHSIVPHVLKAFCALSHRPSLPDSCALYIVRSVFRHAETQTLIQTHRTLAFQVIANLLDHKLAVLKTMKEEFPISYIQMIDGEKDPRILLTVFRLTVRVIKSFPVKICCDDLFEVTSCYFPVDFTPPPGETFQITRQDLADELRITMSCTNIFSQLCIPLLIEKISSDLQSAKQDSFLTLTDCCKVYTVEDFRPHMNVLTQLLVREAMLSSSEKTEQLALQAVASLAQCLSVPNSDGVTVYTDAEEFCKSIIKDCRHHLFEPEHKLVTPSVNLLKALLSANSYNCNLVLNDVIPVILEQLNKTDQTRRKVVYLEMIEKIFSCTSGDVQYHKQLVLPTVLVHINNSQDEVITAALSSLATIAGCLDNNVKDVSSKLMAIFNEMSSSNVRIACLDCIGVICKENQTSAQQYIINPVCESLSELENFNKSRLELLNAISRRCGMTTCNILLPPLLTCYNTSCLTGRSFSRDVLSSISCTVECTPTELEISYLTNFIQTCLNNKTMELSSDVEEKINSVVIQLVKCSRQSDLQTLVNNLYPNLINLPKLSTHGLAALQAILCSLPKQVTIDEKDCLKTLTRFSLNNQINDQVRLSSVKMCASIVNKSHDVDELVTELDHIYSKLTLENVYLWAWIVKALVLRGHRSSNGLLLKLVDLLTEPYISPQAAAIFEIILKEHNEVLSPRQCANIKLMYKQRVFVVTFPKLHNMFTHIGEEFLPNIHIAVTHLIKYVPNQVLSNDKQKLIEVLLKLLNSSDDQVLIRTLQVLMEDPDLELMAQHVDTLITSLLKLTQYASSMRVRISSLKCLAQLSKLNARIILPYMSTIIKTLLPVLGDKKRLVRREAVITRNIWCMLKDEID